MRVRNLQAGDRPVPSGHKSWLQYWEEKSGRKAGACSALGCSQSANLGGHVQKLTGDNKWYIIPICTLCNNKRGQEYDVKADTIFAPVNS